MEVLGLEISSEVIGEWLFRYGLNLLASLLILTLGWLSARLIRRIAANMMQRARLEKILVSFLSNIIYALVLAFVVIAALNKLGIQTASLIAIIGAAGLAVGLALQGSLANFAAGVMIILFRHFKIGDFIQGGGVTGTVVDMNIFTATLHTATNEKVIVPNSSLTGGSLTNFTGNAQRRIDVTAKLAGDTGIDTLRSQILEVAKGEKYILSRPAPYIGVLAVGASDVTLTIRLWVSKNEVETGKSAFIEALKRRCDTQQIAVLALS